MTETGAACPGDGGTGGHWVVWSASGHGYIAFDLLLIADAIQALRELRARQHETYVLLAAFGYVIAAREPGTPDGRPGSAGGGGRPEERRRAGAGRIVAG